MHVVDAPRVWFEGSHWCRSPTAPLGHALAAIGSIVLQLRPPPVRSVLSGARSVLPLNHCRQSVGKSRLFAQPIYVSQGVLPCDEDHGLGFSAPTVVFWKLPPGGVGEQVIFREGDLVLGYCIWTVDHRTHDVGDALVADLLGDAVGYLLSTNRNHNHCGSELTHY